MRKKKPPHPSESPYYLFPSVEERQRLWPPNNLKIMWGNTLKGHTLGELGAAHYLIMGAPRFGKTTLLQLLVKSALITGNEYHPLRYRAFINDPKTHWYQDLRRWGLQDQHIIVTNPFDSRSSSWNMAADLDSPKRVGDFIRDICEGYAADPTTAKMRQEAPIWPEIATQTLRTIIGFFHTRSPDDWDLRDMVNISLDDGLLEEVLKATANGRRVWAKYYGPGSATDNMPRNAQATLHSIMGRFEVTAALWHHANTNFSLKKWREKGCILLLGYDRESEVYTQTTNFLLLKAAAGRVLNSPDTSTDLSWFCLDEIASIGAVPRVLELLNVAASRGARVVITALGWSNLNRAFREPGEANDVIQNTSNKAFVRFENAEDMRWLQQQLGTEWREVESTTTPRDPSQYGSISKQEAERYRFEIEELMQLKRPGDGIDAIIKTGAELPHRPKPPYRLTREQQLGHLSPHIPESDLERMYPKFLERPGWQESLPPWNDDDYAAFGLKPPDADKRAARAVRIRPLPPVNPEITWYGIPSPFRRER